MRPFTLDRLARMYATLPRTTFYRHDVDVSLEAALRMARWETQREVHSTFYVMTTSPFYTEDEALDAAVEIKRLGHRVGLHWDARHPFPAGWHDRAFPTDLAVSFHCPDSNLLWRDFVAFDSAYSARWEGSYYSDSRGRFAHGDPEDRDGAWPIQVSLHPEWWFEPDWIARRNVTAELYRDFFREPIEALA